MGLKGTPEPRQIRFRSGQEIHVCQPTHAGQIVLVSVVLGGGDATNRHRLWFYLFCEGRTGDSSNVFVTSNVLSTSMAMKDPDAKLQVGVGLGMNTRHFYSFWT
jgi:hypothetical protein